MTSLLATMAPIRGVQPAGVGTCPKPKTLLRLRGLESWVSEEQSTLPSKGLGLGFRV